MKVKYIELYDNDPHYNKGLAPFHVYRNVNLEGDSSESLEVIEEKFSINNIEGTWFDRDYFSFRGTIEKNRVFHYFRVGF